jgi:hypothetical protein
MEGVKWINLAQDWIKCQAVVNMVMNIRVATNEGDFLD